MIAVYRAADRFRSALDGITSWHCFSAGAHYDPDNVSFGPVIACDEHLLDPGAGFDEHRHARVEQVSWVLDGALHHRDSLGHDRVVRPGQAQYQLAGSGLTHSERNASSDEALRFVQLWLLNEDDECGYSLDEPPCRLRGGVLDVLRHCIDTPVVAQHAFVYVAAGEFAVGRITLYAGDSLRSTGDELSVSGTGQVLVVCAG